MSHDDHIDLLDNTHTASLCDAGNPDDLAATVVSSDGTQHLVLAQRAALGDTNVRYDPTCADVAHEQLGPLPPQWAARTALAPIRCSRPTKAGTPCRNTVTHPGATCGWHKTGAVT